MTPGATLAPGIATGTGWPRVGGRVFWLHPSSPGDNPAEGADAGRRADGDCARQARILIVEDDWFIATETEAILARAGYQIAGMASEERGAMELAERTRPDLVLMDIKLAQGSDGVAIARKIFETFGIRCIFVTAHSDLATRRRGEAARPHGWLIKPFNNGQLLAAVREALDAG